MADIEFLRSAHNSDAIWRYLMNFKYFYNASSERLTQEESQQIGQRTFIEAGYNIFHHDNSAKDAINRIIMFSQPGAVSDLAYSGGIYKIQELDERYWSQASASNVAAMALTNWMNSPPNEIRKIPPESMVDISAEAVYNMGTVYDDTHTYWFLSNAKVGNFGKKFADQNVYAVDILNQHKQSHAQEAAKLSAAFWSGMVWGIEKLDKRYFAGMSREAFAAISGFNLYWASPEQIAAIPASYFAEISLEQLRSLSIHDANNPAYGVAQSIKGITADQFKAMPDGVLKEMTKEQVQQIFSSVLNSLNAEQLARINTDGLSTQQIEGLGEGFADQNTKAVELLNQFQSKSLTPIELSPSLWQAKIWGIEKLEKSYFARMTREAFAAISGFNLYWASPEQIAAIPASYFAEISLEQLRSLSIHDANNPAYGVAQSIKGITADQFKAMPDGVLKEMTKEQVQQIFSSVLNSLNAEQLARINTDGLSTQQIEGLGEGFADQNTKAVELLNQFQSKSLTPIELSPSLWQAKIWGIEKLDKRYFAGMSREAFAAISGFNLYWASPEQIAAIPASYFAEISLEKLKTFSTGDSNNPAYGIAKSIAGITAEQASKISPAVIAKLTQDIALAMSDEAFAGLTAAQVSSLAPEVFAALRSSQLSHLTPSAVRGVLVTQLEARYSSTPTYRPIVGRSLFVGVAVAGLAELLEGAVVSTGYGALGRSWYADEIKIQAPQAQQPPANPEPFSVQAVLQASPGQLEQWLSNVTTALQLRGALQNFTRTDAAQLGPEQFRRLAELVNYLPDQALAGLNRDAVLHITVTQLHSMSTQRLQQLNVSAVSGDVLVRADVVNRLSISQLRSLSAFEVAQILHQVDNRVATLTPGFFEAITDSALTAALLNHSTTTQAGHVLSQLTVEQISAIGPAVFSTLMQSDENLALLMLNAGERGVWTLDQFHAMLIQALPLLPPKILAAYMSAEGLLSLTLNEIEKISAEQLAALQNELTLGKIINNAGNGTGYWTLEQLHHLNTETVSHMTQTQLLSYTNPLGINVFTQEQQTAMSTNVYLLELMVTGETNVWDQDTINTILKWPGMIPLSGLPGGGGEQSRPPQNEGQLHTSDISKVCELHLAAFILYNLQHSPARETIVGITGNPKLPVAIVMQDATGIRNILNNQFLASLLPQNAANALMARVAQIENFEFNTVEIATIFSNARLLAAAVNNNLYAKLGNGSLTQEVWNELLENGINVVMNGYAVLRKIQLNRPMWIEKFKLSQQQFDQILEASEKAPTTTVHLDLLLQLVEEGKIISPLTLSQQQFDGLINNNQLRERGIDVLYYINNFIGNTGKIKLSSNAISNLLSDANNKAAILILERYLSPNTAPSNYMLSPSVFGRILAIKDKSLSQKILIKLYLANPNGLVTSIKLTSAQLAILTTPGGQIFSVLMEMIDRKKLILDLTDQSTRDLILSSLEKDVNQTFFRILLANDEYSSIVEEYISAHKFPGAEIFVKGNNNETPLITAEQNEGGFEVLYKNIKLDNNLLVLLAATPQGQKFLEWIKDNKNKDFINVLKSVRGGDVVKISDSQNGRIWLNNLTKQDVASLGANTNEKEAFSQITSLQIEFLSLEAPQFLNNIPADAIEWMLKNNNDGNLSLLRPNGVENLFKTDNSRSEFMEIVAGNFANLAKAIPAEALAAIPATFLKDSAKFILPNVTAEQLAAMLSNPDLQKNYFSNPNTINHISMLQLQFIPSEILTATFQQTSPDVRELIFSWQTNLSSEQLAALNALSEFKHFIPPGVSSLNDQTRRLTQTQQLVQAMAGNDASFLSSADSKPISPTSPITPQPMLVVAGASQ